MIKTIARVSLLAALLSFTIQANFLINDYIITPRAADEISKMSSELIKKTGIHAYIVATKEKLGRGVNLHDYSKRFEANITKPYVIYIFAPNSTRIGLIPSGEDIRQRYNTRKVKNYAIDILKSNDSNSQQSKYDVAVVQSYSELADQLATSKGVELNSTIKEESKLIIKLLSYIVWAGLILMIWILLIRPRLQKGN